MQVHARHALCGFFGVVVVIDVDHEAAQQLTHLAGHLDFQLLEFPLVQVVSDVVVCEKTEHRRSRVAHGCAG